MFETSEIPTIFLGIVLAAVLCLYAYSSISEYRKYPPGPIGLPLIGYILFLTRKPYVKFLQLRKKYGPIYSVRLGAYPVVILADFASIKEAFAQDALMGRPPDSIFEPDEKTTAIGAIDGAKWKEQRRFSLQAFRDLGFGKTRMEEHMKEEIEELLGILEGHSGNPVVPSKLLAPSTSNNISSLVFGKRRIFDDPKRVMLDGILRDVNKLIPKVAWLSFFPVLKKVMKTLNIGQQEAFSKVLGRMRNHAGEEIREHQNTLDPNNVRDYIDRYLLEIEKQKDDPQSSFRVHVLQDLIPAFFGAGSETVRNAIDWLLLVSATYPEIQTKIQGEIDHVIGRDRFPFRSDHRQMPYTEAAILETLRWRASLAINIPRYTLEDMKLQSFVIPKHTRVVAVLWTLHHDPELWGEDVDIFKPERFLSEDGKEIKKPEYFVPFSIGKRACPGETLAMTEVFLYLTAILQKFSVKLKEGVTPDLEGNLSISFQAKPHEIIFLPRS